MGAEMTKVPEVGERLLADINGRYDAFGWPVGERFFFVKDSEPGLIRFRFPNNNPKYAFYLIRQDVTWLEKHQIWVLRYE